MDMRNRVTRLRLSRDTCTCSAGASVEQAPSRKPKRERLPKKLKPLGKPEDTQTWARKTGRKRYWQRSGLMAGKQTRTEDWKHFPGRNSSGTSSASKSAFTKPNSAATSSVFAGCNGYCFALFQHDAWPYDRYHKTIGGKRHPE